VANLSTAMLFDLFRLDATTFFASGEAGNVIKSTDGGATWVLLASLGNRVTDQWWLDATTGYVVGALLARRTTNGGATWASIPNVVDVISLVAGEVYSSANLGGRVLFRRSTQGTPPSHIVIPNFRLYLLRRGNRSLSAAPGRA
jgi:photosystem II stability/assembly factor-like uncharacterized protein